MPEFTHDFKLEFDGVAIEGEIEFNEDGLASFHFTNDPMLNLDQADNINRLMQNWHNLFHVFGDNIALIRLKGKTQ
jgi:hypothetical protein